MARKTGLARYHKYIENLYLGGVGIDSIATLFGVKHPTLRAYVFRHALAHKRQKQHIALINAVAAEMRAAKHGLARTEGKGDEG